MIKEVRLDDRLIHGQVAVSWTRALDIEALNSLIELGIKVGMMPTPNDKFVDLKPLLRNKLKGE